MVTVIVATPGGVVLVSTVAGSGGSKVIVKPVGVRIDTPPVVTKTGTSVESARVPLVPVTWYTKGPPVEAPALAAIVRVAVISPLAGRVTEEGENVGVTPVGHGSDHLPDNSMVPLKPLSEVTLHVLDPVALSNTVTDIGSQEMPKPGRPTL
jgi:hypothetical protein